MHCCTECLKEIHVHRLAFKNIITNPKKENERCQTQHLQVGHYTEAEEAQINFNTESAASFKKCPSCGMLPTLLGFPQLRSTLKKKLNGTHYTYVFSILHQSESPITLKDAGDTYVFSILHQTVKSHYPE